MGDVTNFIDDVGDVISDAWDYIAEDPLRLFLPYAIIEAAMDLVSDLVMPTMPAAGSAAMAASTAASPTYKSDNIGNTISEGVRVARVYGTCKIGGNKLRFNAATNSDLRVIVAHCQGPISSYVKLYVNDLDVADADESPAHTRSVYTGTRTQTADARFSKRASAYRGMAYTAWTFEKNDRKVGYNPNITVVVNGMLVQFWDDAETHVFSRNPALVLWDWYLNVEGYTVADLDQNAFLSLFAHCAATPSGSLARSLFDYAFDTDMSIEDAKEIIWRAFRGQVIMSQGKLKPVWDAAQMPDGAGGLTAKTVAHAFTEDNIVKGTFEWSQPERYNTVRVICKDSTDYTYRTTTVEVKDEQDIAINGEILYEEQCFFITNREVALRRARMLFNIFKYDDYHCQFSSFSGAGDLELYDVVTVTHSLAGFSTKYFTVMAIAEDENGRPTFTLRAWYSGMYDDATDDDDEASYASTLPNPYKAESVTSVALAESGFVAGDGSYVPYLTLTFTKPNNPFWFRGQVWTSTNGSDYTFYGNASTGLGYRIEAAIANYAAGNTLYVKVLSENNNGAIQSLANVTAVTELINGKSIPPSDVTGFAVAQIGDVVLFVADRPSQGTDADFSHFELRQGTVWETSQLVSTFTHTRYLLTDFTSGAKTFLIKAVDTSGNKSTNASKATITLAESSVQNVFYEKEIVNRIAAATGVSQLARNYAFDYLGGGFWIAGTAAMDDSLTAKMNDDATTRMWTPAYTSGVLTTEAVDIGAAKTATMFLEITSTEYLGASYTVEYATSTNGSDYSAFANFINGATATLRYVKFKITLATDTTNYPQSNIKISGIALTTNLPTVYNSDNDVTVAIGGTAITFAKPYTTAASIKIATSVAGAAALICTIDDKATTGFTAYVFDPTDGSDTGGTIDWTAEGY